MSRKIVLIGCVAACLMAAAAHADTFVAYLLPNFVVQTAALRLQDGSVEPRFQITHIADSYTTETCVAVILDTKTGQFAATSVSPESCIARRGGAR